MAQLYFERFVYLQVSNPKLVMFKNILSLFLLVFLTVLVGKTNAAIDPNLTEKNETETDSLSVNKSNKTTTVSELSSSPVTPKSESSTVEFWIKGEEDEEDSTSSSALSFNFIYYVIEKFKFQVE